MCAPTVSKYIIPAQDGWQVETRVRLTGKQQGSSYKCFKSPSGAAFWSIKKATEHGFTGLLSGGNVDGRCKPRAAQHSKPGPTPGLKPGTMSHTKPAKKAGQTVKKHGGKKRHSPGKQ